MEDNKNNTEENKIITDNTENNNNISNKTDNNLEEKNILKDQEDINKEHQEKVLDSENNEDIISKIDYNNIDLSYSKEDEKPKRKERRKWSKKKKITVVSSIILVLFLILGIVFGTYIYRANGNLAEAVINVATDVLGNDEPIFVLVLGVSEDIKVELTDTIILAGYNPKTQKAIMVSIPRDTFVGKSEASANGYDKINALYQKDVNKTVEAVEKLTGINIDNYIIVKNTALPAIVDAIGEVEFDVPIDMDYDDPTQDLHIHLEAGMQKINGEKAEQLLRFRHNNDGSSYPFSYGDNDFGRMKTQREFIKVVASQLVSAGSTSNLKAIATAVFDNLVTDMTLGKAIGYIPYALKFDTNSIIMEQLPGESALINELWFYKSSNSETKKLIGELIEELGLTDKEIEKHYQYKIDKSKKSNETDKNNQSSSNTTKTTKSNNTDVNNKNNTKTETQRNQQDIKTPNVEKTDNNKPTTTTPNNKPQNSLTQEDTTNKPTQKPNNGNTNTSNSGNSGTSKPGTTEPTNPVTPPPETEAPTTPTTPTTPETPDGDNQGGSTSDNPGGIEKPETPPTTETQTQ